MKIKSIAAATLIAASSLYTAPSFSQVPSLPSLDFVSGGIGGGMPGLSSIPFLGSIDSFIPAMPTGLDGVIDVTAVPAILPGLIVDLPRSLGNNATAAPGLIAQGAALSPLQSLSTLTGIGGNLGVGALYSLVPLADVAANDPSNIVEYLLGSGTVITQFGIIGGFPGIPVISSPLGLGFGEDLPVLGGLPSGDFGM